MKDITVERIYVYPDGVEKAESDMSAEEISAAEEKIRNELIKRLYLKSAK